MNIRNKKRKREILTKIEKRFRLKSRFKIQFKEEDITIRTDDAFFQF